MIGLVVTALFCFTGVLLVGSLVGWVRDWLVRVICLFAYVFMLFAACYCLS